MEKTEKTKEFSKEDIERFLNDREKIKKVVGRIGGGPSRHERLANIVFTMLLIFSFMLPAFFHGVTRLITIEIGVLLISIKIIYSLSNEARVNHFEFWILSTIEWRLHDLANKVEELGKRLEDMDDAKDTKDKSEIVENCEEKEG